jgi:hypothetical protein
MADRRATLLGGILLASAMSAATLLPANADATEGNAALPHINTPYPCSYYVQQGANWLSAIGHPTSSRTPSTIESLIRNWIPRYKNGTAQTGQYILNNLEFTCGNL